MPDRDDWILDVLADLKAFAGANDLPFLAESLDDARRLAAVELSLRAGNRRPLRRGRDRAEN